MKPYFLQCLLELKLLLRLRWTLLLPPAAFVWTLIKLSAAQAPASQNLYLYLLDSESTLHAFSLLIPVLLGILLVRRDILHPSFEWSHSLPAANWAYIASKFTVACLYMASIAYAPLAAYAGTALKAGEPLGEIGARLLPIAIQYASSHSAAIALGIALGTLIPLRFALPVGFSAWLFGILFLQVFLVERLGWFPLRAFYLNHMYKPLFFQNEVWSSALFQEEMQLILLFAALATLFLLALACAWLGRFRPARPALLAPLLAGVALIAAASAYVPYAGLWQERLQQLALVEEAATLAERQAEELWASGEAPFLFQLSRMELHITRQPDDQLQIAARLEIPTRSGKPLPAATASEGEAPTAPERLSFLLHPAFEVSSLTLNGSPVPWKRAGDQLSLPVSALDAGTERQIIELAYSGKLNQWSDNITGDAYFGFAKGGDVYMPSHIGWFPIPGYPLLFQRIGSYVHDDVRTIAGLSMDIDLTASGFPEGTLYATIPAAADDRGDRRHFVAENAAPPTLFGGGFEQITLPGGQLAIITTASNRQEATCFLAEAEEQLAYYKEWLGVPLGRISQVAYLGIYTIQSPFLYNFNRIDGNTLFAAEGIRNNLDAFRMEALINYALFGDSAIPSYIHPTSPLAYIWEIRNGLRLVYQLERGITFPNPLHHYAGQMGGDSPLPVQADILAAHAAGKLEDAKRVLKRFYMQAPGIRSEEGDGALPRAAVPPGGEIAAPTAADWKQAWKEVQHDR